MEGILSLPSKRGSWNKTNLGLSVSLFETKRRRVTEISPNGSVGKVNLVDHRDNMD